MNDRKKKFIAPIVVTVIVCLYFVLYFGLMITQLSGFWKVALGVLPLLCAAVMIKVCMERIKEIKKGEEDDISQY